MRLAVVVNLTGALLRLFGAAPLAPLAVAAYYGERADVPGFAVAALLAAVLGHLMSRAASEPADVRRVEGMAVVAGTRAMWRPRCASGCSRWSRS